MMIGKAAATRIQMLCKERDISLNMLGTISGVTQSTLNNIISRVSKNPTISTIKKICDGLNSSIVAFFDVPIFRELDQEIQ